ncbi:MAG: Flp pilus assembly protein TadB [Deltaproteobacteria bacterium]|nr:Flp pilus assembly protein TadB [Deltaproteobacteria bacterium]
MSAIPVLNQLLGQRRASVVSLQKMIDQSGVRTNVGTVLLSSLCLGLATFVIVWWFSRALLVALGLGLLALTLPFFRLRRAREKRTRKFEELFPEAIDLIARSLRAGHAFTTGLAMVADEVPDPVGKEFRLLYDQQNYGMPIPDALRTFGERIPLLDAKFFVTAVLTQRDAGGNLSEVLDNLSSVIRDRFKVKREVRARSAHGRLTGWILALLPPSLALALYLVSPEWMGSLVKDPLGVRMVIAAIAFQVIGTLIIRKIVDIEY